MLPDYLFPYIGDPRWHLQPLQAFPLELASILQCSPGPAAPPRSALKGFPLSKLLSLRGSQTLLIGASSFSFCPSEPVFSGILFRSPPLAEVPHPPSGLSACLCQVSPHILRFLVWIQAFFLRVVPSGFVFRSFVFTWSATARPDSSTHTLAPSFRTQGSLHIFYLSSSFFLKFPFSAWFLMGPPTFLAHFMTCVLLFLESPNSFFLS